MNLDIEIRHAVKEDLKALTVIYNHYVVETPFTFDLEPKSIEERTEWLSHYSTTGPYQLFVAIKEGRLIGYASSSKFREKKAYETSVETTIYLEPNSQHKGTGSLLYDALFKAIDSMDIHRAYAGITQPNAASVALHEKCGFISVGLYKEVGRKFGRFWDVQWFEKPLK